MNLRNVPHKITRQNGSNSSYHMYTMLTAIHEGIQLLTPYETTLQEFLSHSSSEQQWRLELANQDLLQLYFVLAQAP